MLIFIATVRACLMAAAGWRRPPEVDAPEFAVYRGPDRQPEVLLSEALYRRVKHPGRIIPDLALSKHQARWLSDRIVWTLKGPAAQEVFFDRLGPLVCGPLLCAAAKLWEAGTGTRGKRHAVSPLVILAEYERLDQRRRAAPAGYMRRMLETPKLTKLQIEGRLADQFSCSVDTVRRALRRARSHRPGPATRALFPE